MSDPHTPCPSCGAKLRGTAEMAAHACPGPDPDHQTLDAALAASRNNLLRRQGHLPTHDNLRSDAASVAAQISQFWDGDVEVFVILRARDSGAVAARGTFTEKEKLERVLRGVLSRLPDLVRA